MNKRLTKKCKKRAIQSKVNTSGTAKATSGASSSCLVQEGISGRVYVTRNSHPDYPYALLDQNYKFITNLLKLSEARSYCKQEYPKMQIDVIRNLDRVYEAITA